MTGVVRFVSFGQTGALTGPFLTTTSFRLLKLSLRHVKSHIGAYLKLNWESQLYFWEHHGSAN